MNRFDELLEVTLRNAVLAEVDHLDRERERCDTGRPHSPIGIVGNMLGCKCRPWKTWTGLQGFIDAPYAEVKWYGNVSDVRARRSARIVDITEA